MTVDGIEFARRFALWVAVCSFVALAILDLLGVDGDASITAMLGAVATVFWVVLEAERRGLLPDEGDQTAGGQ